MGALDAVMIELVQAVPAHRIIGHFGDQCRLAAELDKTGGNVGAANRPWRPSSRCITGPGPGGIGRKIHPDPADHQEIPGLMPSRTLMPGLPFDPVRSTTRHLRHPCAVWNARIPNPHGRREPLRCP
jgi:hypothetical protein